MSRPLPALIRPRRQPGSPRGGSSPRRGSSSSSSSECLARAGRAGRGGGSPPGSSSADSAAESHGAKKRKIELSPQPHHYPTAELIADVITPLVL
ncbi:unnamed protein product [Lampetra fluviatilis]